MGERKGQLVSLLGATLFVVTISLFLRSCEEAFQKDNINNKIIVYDDFKDYENDNKYHFINAPEGSYITHDNGYFESFDSKEKNDYETVIEANTISSVIIDYNESNDKIYHVPANYSLVIIDDIPIGIPSDNNIEYEYIEANIEVLDDGSINYTIPFGYELTIVNNQLYGYKESSLERTLKKS